MALVSSKVPQDEVLFTGVFRELHRRLTREDKDAKKTQARRERLRRKREKTKDLLPQTSNESTKRSSERRSTPRRRPTAICKMAASFLDLEISDDISSEEYKNNYECYSEVVGYLRRESKLRRSRKGMRLPFQSPKINGDSTSRSGLSSKTGPRPSALRKRRVSNKAVPVSATNEDESTKPSQMTNLTLPCSAGLEEKPQSSDSITKIIRSQVLWNEQLRHREKQLGYFRQLKSELAPPPKFTDSVSQFKQRFNSTMTRFTRGLEKMAKAQFKLIQEDRDKIDTAITEAFQEQDDEVLEWEKHWKMNRRYIECGLKYPIKKKTIVRVRQKRANKSSDTKPLLFTSHFTPAPASPEKDNQQLDTESKLESLFKISNLTTSKPPDVTLETSKFELSARACKESSSKPPLSIPTTFSQATPPSGNPFFQTKVPSTSDVTLPPIAFGNTSEHVEIDKSIDFLSEKELDQCKESQIWSWKNRAKKIKDIYDYAESTIAKAKASNPRGLRKVSLKVRKIFAQLSAIQSVVIEKNRELNKLFEDHPELVDALMCRVAKELVSKADSAVTKNHDIVYSFAYIALMQVRRNKEFLKYFLCYLATRCPFVIPALLQRTDFGSDDEWYTALGFIEKHDVPRDTAIENNFAVGETKIFEPVLSYLNRVGSCIQLYGAFIQITPNRGEKHPHDMMYAWVWLARVLNNPPNLGTARALHSFIGEVSHQMIKTYPVQFKAILAFLRKDYLARLPQDSNEMHFGYNKLVNLLEEYNTFGIRKQSGTLLGNKVTSGA